MEESRTPQKRLHSIESHFEPSMAEQSGVEKQRAACKGRPRETGELKYSYPLKDSPGKTVVAMTVSYAPNGYTPPHYHAGAEVIGMVLEGKILSKMDDMPEQVYGPGESWYERPGCHHVKSENASADEPAKLLATFIINSDFTSLIQYDWE